MKAIHNLFFIVLKTDAAVNLSKDTIFESNTQPKTCAALPDTAVNLSKDTIFESNTQHVSKKFAEYNRLGVPNGYNAFATRGYADREEYLLDEIKIAQEISGKDIPNMIVYGGGESIRQICLQAKVIYVEQFMTNKRKGEVING